MSEKLIERMRAARSRDVEVNGRKFTIMRPTDYDMVQLVGKDAYALLDFVVGWDMTELDLWPGGTGAKVPFDKQLWREWIADNPSFWEPLISAIRDAYAEHAKTLEGDAKN